MNSQRLIETLYVLEFRNSCQETRNLEILVPKTPTTKILVKNSSKEASPMNSGKMQQISINGGKNPRLKYSTKFRGDHFSHIHGALSIHFPY